MLDETHPMLKPVVEILSAYVLPTPDVAKVKSRVKELHDTVALRNDPDLPFDPGNRLECRALAFTAPSFYGKSRSIREALKSLPPIVLPDGSHLEPKVLRFRCPSYASMSTFLNSLLRATGYPDGRDMPPGAALSRLMPALATRRYTALWLDEFQWALYPATSPGRSRQEEENAVWNTLSGILDSAQWPIPVVVSGLPSIVASINHDSLERQALRNRFDFESLTAMTLANSGDVTAIFTIYSGLVGVSVQVDTALEIEKRLIHAANYSLGLVLLLIKIAFARAAARDDKTVAIDDFKAAYAVKMNCRDEANPFAVDQWREIDPTLIMAQSAGERRPAPPAPSAKKKK
ncbi:AAA family ATPase [Devosia submarina]|uniref:AAA family ATPase n=1 Tax=Devosia submarina TaxID=1173082 RepID=UPI0013003F0D|nr:AAA family ATPase [Devosia submarina]